MELACVIDYLDEADVLAMTETRSVPGPIIGVLMMTESKPAKGTIMVWDEEHGRPEQFDLIENAQVFENSDGSSRVVGDSMRAEGAFGVGNSRVTLKVTPR